jgi:hypothetical protein
MATAAENNQKMSWATTLARKRTLWVGSRQNIEDTKLARGELERGMNRVLEGHTKSIIKVTRMNANMRDCLLVILRALGSLRTLFGPYND